MSDVSDPRARRALAVAAVALAVAAPLAGSPFVRERARIDVDRLAATVQHEEDHVTAVELARWIRERHAGLRVLDVRGAEDFAAYHIPAAERAPLDSVVRIPFRASDTIVLYSEGGPHAAQAWVLLRALGYERVYFLRGGLYEWLTDVMNPTIAEHAPPAARAEFEKVAELSRYFGGQPRIADALPSSAADAVPLPTAARDTTRASTASTPSTASLVRAIRRRGC